MKRTRPGQCWRCTSLKRQSKANEMPEAVEVPMETDLSKYGLPTLIGVLDLVRAGGRIVDFKSTGKTPDPEDAIHQNETQLSCYSVLYREATGHRESGRELHHLVKTKTPKLVITATGPDDRHAAGQVVSDDGVVCRGVGQGRLRAIAWVPLCRL